MVDITNRNPFFFVQEGHEALAKEAESVAQTALPIGIPVPPLAEALENQTSPVVSESAVPEQSIEETQSSHLPIEPSIRFLRPQRGFDTSAMRSHLSSQLLQQTQTGSSSVKSNTHPEVGKTLAPISREDSGQNRQGGKEQIRETLLRLFPQFAMLPPQLQTLIAEVYIEHPELPIETAIALIQATETISFHQLGSADRQTFVKLLGSLMASPEYRDSVDTRVRELVDQIARGILDLRFIRVDGAGQGRVDAAGLSLNMADPQLQAAISAALRGDTQRLTAILLSLAHKIPQAQAEDPVWQSLENSRDARLSSQFASLGEVKTQVYQAIKSFPEANPKRIVEYAALPTREFQQALPPERSAELRLLAALDLESSKPRPNTSESPTLSERLINTEVSVKVYRDGDGRKVSVEGKEIRLNLADPSVQRSLETDAKLAVGAVLRLGVAAVRQVDTKAERLEQHPGVKRLDKQTRSLLAAVTEEYPDADPELLAKFAESQELASRRSGRERAHAMRFIASVLHQVAADPQRLDLAYQSILRLINGDIPLNGFMHEAAGLVADGSGISIDPKYLVEDRDENLVQLVAEVNQALHERPGVEWGGTIAMFASDYRAAYAEEFFRTGSTPSAGHMRQVMGTLLNPRPSNVYAQLSYTYDTDPEFKSLVDEIYSRLEEDRVVEPEELRQMLLEMIGRSPNISPSEQYEQPWILDNHSPFPDATTVLAKVAGRPEFDGLQAREQAVVVNMVRKYGVAVGDFCRFVKTDAFSRQSEEHRLLLLRVFGTLSSLAGREEGEQVRAVLSRLLTGRVEIEFVQEGQAVSFEGSRVRLGLKECSSRIIDDWVCELIDILPGLKSGNSYGAHSGIESQ